MNPFPRTGAIAALLVPLLLSPFACDEGGTNNDDPPGSPEGSLLSHSGCKFGVEGRPKAEADVDVATWTYDGGVLQITHVNAGFNCCVDTLTAVFEIAGDTIRVREGEMLENGGCRCLCLYDLEYEVENLSAGPYRIEFDEMYLPEGETPLVFDAVLTEGATGEYEVVRGAYPWGVESRSSPPERGPASSHDLDSPDGRRAVAPFGADEVDAGRHRPSR